METSKLSGAALDWAVGLAEGITMNPLHRRSAWISYSTDWSYGGFILERERIAVWVGLDEQWHAQKEDASAHQTAERPLIAAMRCHVASKLGDDIRIPEGLE